ncbi:MAG: replication restart helicase PriA [Longimicrobiales bacterium]
MLVEVALPVPPARTFTYRTEEEVAPGTRVRVQFSGRRMIGWVVGPARPRKRAPDRIRSIERVLEDTPSITPELLALSRWTADYYFTSLGIVLRTAVPTLLTETARTKEPVRTRRVVRIAAELPSLQQREETFGRARRQRECYELLEASGGALDFRHLIDELGFSSSVIDGLVQKQLVVLDDEPLVRDPFAAMPPPPPSSHRPTTAQADAIAKLVSASRAAQAMHAADPHDAEAWSAPGDASAADQGDEPADTSVARLVTESRAPQPYLLLGVTGSGKTLVYIELLKEVLRAGRGAIVLVPEIALTPQTVARFRAEFGDVVAVLHSALSDGERYDAWRALRTGERRVAIGARSAIFAPVHDLGAIIVDEEHESSYKQSEAPRYHARELAVVRARIAGAVCVLGSATPSLESWHNVGRGKYELLRLPDRVEGRPLPPVHVVDLRRRTDPRTERTPQPAAPRDGSLSAVLVEAIRERLARDEQTILLLNRRGYATFVQCRACGAVWHCPHCNVTLTYHRARRRLVCHYCFHEEAPPERCDRCGSADLNYRGVGTEQVEREVADRFPHARVARMDVDTTSAKWAHHEILERVERGELDILLGTQMIAKGLDFPGVTLVGVVNADVAMNLPDFRASERTFQLLTQVAGRAGRGPKGGAVIVQTSLPQHYAIQCAVTHDFEGFAGHELAERQSPPYPPLARMINVVLSGTDERAVTDVANDCERWLRAALPPNAPIELIGPAPCAIDRVRGRWRWHLLIRSGSARAIGAAGRLLQRYPLRPGRAELRLILDRDPVSLL